MQVLDKLFGEKKFEEYSFFMRKIGRDAWIFNSLPFVKEIAICNTVAFKTADLESDIDLLIILKKNRFFLGRLFLSLSLHILRLRRHGGNVKQRYCLSFFVDEDHLDFSGILIKNDVYFYYWFRNLKFLYGDVKLQNEILELNQSWFEESKWKFENLNLFKKNFLAVILEKIFDLKVFTLIEKNMGQYQLNRAIKKNKRLGEPFGVIIKAGLLKFHIEDVRKAFRDTYFSFLDK